MTLLAHAPRLAAADARRLALDLFAVDADARPLPSERDQNFLLTARTSGDRYVLKVANGLESRPLLEAQNEAMTRVADRTGGGARPIATRTGETIAEATPPAGDRHFVRLIGFLPGVPWAEVAHRPPDLLPDLGRAIAEVDAALAGWDHPALHRPFHWDLSTGVDTCRRLIGDVADPDRRATLDGLLGTFDRITAPRLPRLPVGVIHNDANDHNVIVTTAGTGGARRPVVAGLVDFGDMVVSWTVGDLAVAIAYAVLDAPDPLCAAARVAAGYHAERPLGEDELGALWGLACLRLCLSVCHAADQTRQRPGDPYLAISQDPIGRTLPLLARTPWALAEATFRHACGLEPVAASPRVRSWLAANRSTFAPVLAGHDPRTAPTTMLDLGIGSPLVSGDPRENAEPSLTPRIDAAMAEAGAVLGIGRYGEARLLYDAPMFATGPRPDAEHRTVHLGVDLFAPAGTPVHAPLDGVVAAWANNASRLDYGGVILLSHRAGDGTPFHTLYGHLAPESFTGLRAGRSVAKGERIATLGGPDVNGGWTPHLHLQVITDTLGLGTDLPGVGTASQRGVWESIAPDPSPLLGLEPGACVAATPDPGAALAERRARLGANLSIAYDEPLQIERGWMQYLYDAAGRRYLDAYNNVPHVGHAHPRVVRAGHEQMAVLNTNTRYLHPLVSRYAERLCALLPDPLRVCWFVNSGSEANELALRLARAHTRRRDVIVLEGAYHGNTTTLIDISPYKHLGPGGEGTPPWVHVVPQPDVYRGPVRRGAPDPGAAYARFVGESIAAMERDGRGPAAFIAESCPSVGGQIVLPDGYLASVYAHVRRAGGVCIADEVQTGLGRIGTHCWAFEAQGVVPDIVVLGKPIGNGHPLGAVITTREIAASFDNGMEYFSTFGGNPVSCAIGLAVLDVVRDEGLQAHALRVGERMLAGLRRFTDRHPLVGEVRGSGLFLGVELVRDRGTLEPAAAEASRVVNRMREEGILLGTDGPLHNVVKIRPPMPFTAADGDSLIATLDAVLGELQPIGP